jgi:hypothetical protein
LAAAELDDAIDRVLVVVEGEVVGGVGDELVGGCWAEGADGDAGDAAEEGVPVVFGHFLQGVESGEDEDEPGVGLD